MPVKMEATPSLRILIAGNRHGNHKRNTFVRVASKINIPPKGFQPLEHYIKVSTQVYGRQWWSAL